MKLLHAPRLVNAAGPVLVVAAGLLAGCSADGGRVPVQDLNPSEAAARALADYDTNQDGFLDHAELERCPALKASLKSLDRDGDGRLSAQEIADHLALYHSSGIGRIHCACQVLWQRKPLAGASVRLVPEAFLGPAFKTASGQSDEHGRVVLRVEGEAQPGLACGFYRVLISKLDSRGREMIPARYNKHTILGCEVAPAMRRGLTFHLTRAGS